VVFRPEVGDDEKPCAHQRFHDLCQQLVATAIKPVQVLEVDDRRGSFAPEPRDPLHHGMELAPAGLRIDARPRLGRIGDSEKVEQQRQCFTQRVVEQRDPRGNRLAHDRRRVLIGIAEEAAEQLDDGQERDCLPVRYPVRLVCRDSPLPTSIQKFEAEPTLADAWRGHDADDLPAPLHRVMKSRIERRHLFRAADEA
jgi:hypothetical protein